MKSKLKGVVIGAGEQAGYTLRHAVTRVEDVTAVACYDLRFEAAERFAKSYGLRPYDDMAEMMERERPDLVWICTPPVARLEIVQALLDGGFKPAAIQVEKPSALTLAEHDRMCELAKAAGVIISFGYDKLYSAIEWLGQVAESGILGDLLEGYLGWLRFNGVPRRGVFTNPALSGGGPGFDLFTHQAALAGRVCNGLSLHSVTATTSRAMIEAGGSLGDLDPATVGVEDRISGTLEFRDGSRIVPVTFDTAWDLAIPEDLFEVKFRFTGGSFSLERQVLENDDEVYVPKVFMVLEGCPVDVTPRTSFLTLAECRAALLADVAAAVRSRRSGVDAYPRVTPEVARAVLQAVVGAYASAAADGEPENLLD